MYIPVFHTIMYRLCIVHPWFPYSTGTASMVYRTRYRIYHHNHMDTVPVTVGIPIYQGIIYIIIPYCIITVYVS